MIPRPTAGPTPTTPAPVPVDPWRRWHYGWLAVAAGVVVLACVLEVLPDGRVAVRGRLDAPLPELCASRRWFGTPCPGCGLTRGMVHLAHADWSAATRVHRLSPLIACAILSQFPYRALALRLRRPPFGTLAPTALVVALGAALVVNWFVNLLSASGRLP